ncbi:Coenzyme F420 hydrogenase/dehydrogenase, beta subunit C-terminal domain [Parabacteroides segnis]|uniref:Coenzyme F420 hydrogenase/dehydrogenase, beta subunit C-terminal domain n=1 Tax=Parabacteroides segnis TaxID=2763058 RepID=UPI0035127BDD
MIKIDSKEKCCGCWACVQRCPKHCITMVEDDEGFLYPKVDSSLCIDCSLCEKVCPVINQGEPRIPDVVYAAKNLNEEIRMASSSGGIFTLLAEEVIAKGGVVFGARFNEEWDVVHDYTETIEGLSAFRGSKYVQSRVGKCYSQVEEFLEKGRKVLFSGTPCQIAGLKKFLRKEYEDLFMVDFICHGVPSPGVWRLYLKEIQEKVSHKSPDSSSFFGGRKVFIKNIFFRDKQFGWKKFSSVFHFLVAENEGMSKESILFSETLNKNIFLRGFLMDLYLRPSCYLCPSKSLKSGSDITIGDYWGIALILPDFDDDKGVSAVVANSGKGKYLLKSLKMEYRETSYEDVKIKNPAIEYSSCFTQKRNLFYRMRNDTIHTRVEKLCKQTLEQQIKGIAYVVIFKLGLYPLFKRIKSLL